MSDIATICEHLRKGSDLDTIARTFGYTQAELEAVLTPEERKLCGMAEAEADLSLQAVVWETAVEIKRSGTLAARVLKERREARRAARQLELPLTPTAVEVEVMCMPDNGRLRVSVP